ncbi:MAG: NADH-quinone oxidoreductase subunit C [Gammaproteobacteria bacterium]|jgi:NADH-quinone oxidoreductase subunit C|nr:NADH-quinone oxidoreductase subunit C [Gammaproteobacteria bacterium]
MSARTTTPRQEALATRLAERFGESLVRVPSRCGELGYEVAPAGLLAAAEVLRTEFAFEMLLDLCAVDYLAYGRDEWETHDATSAGFSRAAERGTILADPGARFDPRRFAVVYHLLSVSTNARLRLTVYTGPDNPPVVPSATSIWASANWYEREAFDLYGILFEGHPDLRRLLTDYGFIGHPFRKDFPLSGNLEVRYDPEQGRVVYQPVSIEPRTLVPRVIRDDNRYSPDLKDRHG